MSKPTITFEMDEALHSAFVTAAESVQQPVSVILEKLVLEFVQSSVAPEYEQFLGRKADAGRASVRERKGQPNSVVESIFTERRKNVPLAR